MKQQLFKKTLILGAATCALGLFSACASLEEDETIVAEREVSTTASPSQGVCTAENQGNCIVTYEEPDLNLGQTYAGYAVSTNSSYQAGSGAVALSQPAQIDGLSVKDKVAQRAFAQQQADLVLKPVPGGEVVCTGDACSEALFKTEIEKTIRTTVTENQTAQATGYVYAAATGQMVPAGVQNGQTVTPQNGQTVTSQNGQGATAQTGTSAQAAEPRTVPLTERIAFGEEVHDWEAPAGETLRHLLMRWGEMSGWTVVWKLDRDYNLEAGVVFRGKFTEVAAAFIRSFARATPAPIGTFYKGNRVLVINTQENENAD